MRNSRYVSSAIILILSLMVAAKSYAQHPVLFETFTNVCDPCPDPNRQTFDNDVKSTLSSKVIHLDYHVVNHCDIMEVPNPNGDMVGVRLAEWTDTKSFPVFYGAVDRTTFSSTGVRVTPLNASGSGSDWGDAINSLSGNPAPASITLINATLDTTTSGQNWYVHADVLLTALRSISDNINIYFAITQDGVTIDHPQTSGNSKNLCLPERTGPYDGVVRWVTTLGKAVFTGAASAGATKQVSWDQGISDHSTNPTFNFANMKLIAFLEESSNSTDYHVVNAAILKTRLDTLKAPTPALALVDTAIDNHTFKAGLQYGIRYTDAHLVHGLRAFYSIDNGANWIGPVVDSFDSFGKTFNWTAPDVETTQGKFKLVSVDDASLTVIEKGTFTIVRGASVQILRPNSKDTLAAGKHFLIQWTKNRVDTISKITLTIGLGTPTTITNMVAKDTFYDWVVPDTNAIAHVQIVPTSYEVSQGAAASTSEQFLILKTFIQGVVVSPLSGGEFAILDVVPNPSERGTDISVRYELPTTSDITFEVFDVLGHIVAQQMLHSAPTLSKISLPVGGLPSGSYILHMTDGQHSVSKRIEILR
jgi:hypothetical protein